MQAETSLQTLNSVLPSIATSSRASRREPSASRRTLLSVAQLIVRDCLLNSSPMPGRLNARTLRR